MLEVRGYWRRGKMVIEIGDIGCDGARILVVSGM
jgi:hypothetical protein